jgi:hypothetical protein
MIIDNAKDIFIYGSFASGTVTASYRNTVNNTGTFDTYPVFLFRQISAGATPVVLKYIKNYSTGETLWLNYTMQIDEEIIIDLSTGEKTITSSFYGNISRAILRNSDVGTFKLQPGNNDIGVFVDRYDGGQDIEAHITWDILHWSIDGAAI